MTIFNPSSRVRRNILSAKTLKTFLLRFIFSFKLNGKHQLDLKISTDVCYCPGCAQSRLIRVLKLKSAFCVKTEVKSAKKSTKTKIKCLTEKVTSRPKARNGHRNPRPAVAFHSCSCYISRAMERTKSCKIQGQSIRSYVCTSASL